MTTTVPPERSTSAIARQAIPALIIGIGTALAYVGVSAVADQFEHVLWDWLPETLGTDGANRWWIFGMLTATGVAVGLIVWLVPGHAGTDPATTELVSEPPPLVVLPGIMLALIVGLAGGVSLGPENPIIAINVGLAAWLLSKIVAGAPAEFAVLLAVSGTLGAMFGTPIAAALLLTEMKAMHQRGELWDNMFAPLVAAGIAGITTDLLSSGMSLSVGIPSMGQPGYWDVLTGAVIALAAALLGLVAVYLFDPMHTLFHRLPNPLITLTLGGLVLGILGAIGGEITLFKGLDQMGELASTVGDYTVAGLLLIVVVKIGALLVAAAAGFRGGRIFPSVFVGLAIGEVAHAIDNDIPLALAVGCGILGFVLAVNRSGWLALFLGVAVVGQVVVLPVLCLTILPVWLLVSARPKMIAAPE
ncbi:ion channel protein [Aldersonia kunmingensis]|uniref:ion channel protein n=1 Tax=Aldersonia kunmingensis TaxID=408066 RepID=UPI000AA048B8|nr:ion channel protein [Aldersonia kunmingensis]